MLHLTISELPSKFQVPTLLRCIRICDPTAIFCSAVFRVAILVLFEFGSDCRDSSRFLVPDACLTYVDSFMMFWYVFPLPALIIFAFSCIFTHFTHYSSRTTPLEHELVLSSCSLHPTHHSDKLSLSSHHANCSSESVFCVYLLIQAAWARKNGVSDSPVCVLPAVVLR